MMKHPFGGGDQIHFELRGKAGVITLTRPKSLNAVTHEMVLALQRALEAWQEDRAVKLIIVQAEGRAFSAGGDIIDVYKAGAAGKPLVQFFADEYRLNAMIAAYPKPYVAIMDGMAMGGGVGISYHGSHRIVTENAVFAMPETGIGFFPDVGGSFLLPRLRGAFGMFLGLCGTRVRWGDQLMCGLATHAARSQELEALVDELARVGDPDQVIKGFCERPIAETDKNHIQAIDIYFSHPSLECIIESLRRDADQETFAAEILALLQKRSPTSLHVTFRQIRSGAMLSMPKCMRMEFRILNRMLRGTDFYEGIRAVVVDKDNAPIWCPSSLSEVSQTAIDSYFEPIGSDLKL